VINGTSGPVSLEELLKKHPHQSRITGWWWDNPPAVELAYRKGYVIGASRCAECDLATAEEFTDRMHLLRGDAYHNREIWSDRRTAVLRGAMQGGLDAVRARAIGVKKGLGPWLQQLRTWAAEDPIRLEWSSAKPPDAPEPDGPALGRTDVPRGLWGEVFGLWATIDMADKHSNNISGPVIVRLSDVQPEQVRWLWPGRIAMGKLTLLCGDPGLGKSFVTLDLAARVSSGTCWPDLPLLTNAPGGVVLLSAEDDLADTIRPRLDAAGANPSRIVAIQAVRRKQPTGQIQEAYFDLSQDLPALEKAIQRAPECRLVVIDPLTAYLGDTDSHKNAEVRAVLAKLFDLAARLKVAVLAVTHLNKAGGLPAIYRAMGSLAFVAAARAVWAVVRDENDETGRRRLFVPVKNNLGADESGLAYTLEPAGDTARVVWEATPITMRADDALNGGRIAAVQEDAREFVLATLNANGGNMLSAELTEAAKANGISERTLRRARKAVAEVYREKGKEGQWRCRVKDGQL
jgi:putative DNA primase/helicase